MNKKYKILLVVICMLLLVSLITGGNYVFFNNKPINKTEEQDEEKIETKYIKKIKGTTAMMNFPYELGVMENGDLLFINNNNKTIATNVKDVFVVEIGQSMSYLFYIDNSGDTYIVNFEESLSAFSEGLKIQKVDMNNVVTVSDTHLGSGVGMTYYAILIDDNSNGKLYLDKIQSSYNDIKIGYDQLIKNTKRYLASLYNHDGDRNNVDEYLYESGISPEELWIFDFKVKLDGEFVYEDGAIATWKVDLENDGKYLYILNDKKELYKANISNYNKGDKLNFEKIDNNNIVSISSTKIDNKNYIVFVDIDANVKIVDANNNPYKK